MPSDARRVHARFIKTQFSSEVFVHNRLIDAYDKCGSFDDARKVFEFWVDAGARPVLVEVDGFGLAQQGRYEQALEWFVNMHGEGVVLNEYTFGSRLSACAGLREVKMGVQIHGVIAKSCCASDVYMGSALIDMYSKCWNVACTQRVFDCMSVRNIVSGNSLITCYEQNGPAREAVQVFLRMMDIPRQQV
ncbi:hypothetical protein ACLB2K_077438 [Fragaria x ananassa]